MGLETAKSQSPEDARRRQQSYADADRVTEKKLGRGSESLRMAMFREAKASSERKRIARQFANVSKPLDILEERAVRRAPAKFSRGGRIAMPIDTSLPCPRCGANPRYGCEHIETVR